MYPAMAISACLRRRGNVFLELDLLFGFLAHAYPSDTMQTPMNSSLYLYTTAHYTIISIIITSIKKPFFQLMETATSKSVD